MWIGSDYADHCLKEGLSIYDGNKFCLKFISWYTDMKLRKLRRDLTRETTIQQRFQAILHLVV